jgi:hypothetical protein
MKKLNKFFHLAFFFFLISISILFIRNGECQWQSDVRLTNAPDTSRTSFGSDWCIATSGNYVHIVWIDKRDGNTEIYYKCSTDGGINWQADVRLTNDPE